MSIRVQKEDGSVEELIIDGPCHVQIGMVLNRLIDSDGREYFFTKDGHYDGWGQEGSR